MSNLHPEYLSLLSTLNTSSLKSSFNSIQGDFVDRAISKQYNLVDELNQHISELKEQHTNELLELKLKLSNLIDTNYNLMQLLNKDTDAKV